MHKHSEIEKVKWKFHISHRNIRCLLGLNTWQYQVEKVAWKFQNRKKNEVPVGIELRSGNPRANILPLHY